MRCNDIMMGSDFIDCSQAISVSIKEKTKMIKLSFYYMTIFVIRGLDESPLLLLITPKNLEGSDGMVGG